MERFTLFCDQADRLAARRLVRNGLDTNMTIRAGGGPPTVTWSRPDDEDFRAFLVDLRPFISDGEPVFLNGIYNLIDQHVTDTGLREEARRSRSLFQAVESGADFRRSDRSPAQIAGDYIDGTFHVDPGARARSGSADPFSAQLDQWFVHDYCAGVTLRVAEVSSILRRAIAGGLVSEIRIQPPTR
jgi:hypothetical protein